MASKRIRVPKNMDDDEEVEIYVAALAKVEDDKENSKEIARNKSLTSDVLTNKILEKVDRIATNIANGDSVNSSITEAYLFINSSNLNGKNAVRVLVSGLLTESVDYNIFASLICDDFGASDLLKSMMNKYPDFKASIPEIVENGITRGVISVDDKTKFVQLFSTWAAGIKWNKCKMTETNRPSLGSWNGWPWEAYNLNEASLLRNVTGTNVQVWYDRGLGPLELVGAENKDLFKLIWSSKDGKSENISESLTTAIQEFEERNS